MWNKKFLFNNFKLWWKFILELMMSSLFDFFRWGSIMKILYFRVYQKIQFIKIEIQIFLLKYKFFNKNYRIIILLTIFYKNYNDFKNAKENDEQSLSYMWWFEVIVVNWIPMTECNSEMLWSFSDGWSSKTRFQVPSVALSELLLLF